MSKSFKQVISRLFKPSSGNEVDARRIKEEQICQENTKPVFNNFNYAAGPDRSSIPLPLIENPSDGMQKLSKVKEAIHKQISAIGTMPNPKSSPSSELDTRITKIAVAMYFVDKIEEMAEVVNWEKDAVLASYFNAAYRRVIEILGESFEFFFSKSIEQISKEYMDAEATLASCAARCGSQFLKFDEAVKCYRKKLEEEALGGNLYNVSPGKHSMPDEEVYRKREREAAIHIDESNRKQLISFYKQLGQRESKGLSEELLTEERSSTALAEAEKIFNNQLNARAAKKLQENEGVGEITDAANMKLALALFLIEHTKNLREAVLSKNHLSLFSLYASMRNQVCEMVGEKYYSKSFEEVKSDYKNLEPLIIAVSELCGLTVPSLTDIIVKYGQRVSRRLMEVMGIPMPVDRSLERLKELMEQEKRQLEELEEKEDIPPELRLTSAQPSYPQIATERPSRLKKDDSGNVGQILSSTQVLDKIKEAGVDLRDGLRGMLRLPRRMVKGVGEYEFFDTDSVQPIQLRPEDSPSYCYDKGLPAPAWIKERYVSFTEEKGKVYMTFVDATRGIFVKGGLSEHEQGGLAKDIYNKLITVPGAAKKK